MIENFNYVHLAILLRGYFSTSLAAPHASYKCSMTKMQMKQNIHGPE